MKDGVPVMNPAGDVYNYNNTINQTSNGGYTDETITTPGTDGTDPVYGTRKVTKTKDYSKKWQGPKSEEYPDGMPYDVWIKRPGNRQKEKDFVKSQQYEVDEKYLISEGTKGTKGSTSTKRTYNPSGNNTATIHNSPGKYKLGGYRAMKAFRK